MLRALGKPITGEEWVWLGDGAGQRLYHPPDVSGWDDERWLDSNTVRARWDVVNYAVAGPHACARTPTAGARVPGRDAGGGGGLRARVLAGPAPRAGDGRAGCSPTPASSTRRPTTRPRPQWRREQRAQQRAQRQTALRHLIAVSADYQTS